MDPERWQQIENIFQAVLQHDGAERGAYLAQACAGDESLRREVESLLKSLERQNSFIEVPVTGFGLNLSSTESNEGQFVKHYKVISFIGNGAMGDVYLAVDTLLRRKVALKSLRQTLINDESSKRRFLKEARAAARLRHPNICTIHELVEEKGHSYIVMDYVEGETLACRAHPSPPDFRFVLTVAIQIAEALVEAHSHGVIHRDIKPQNIMITAGGKAIVLDFGLAKVVQQEQTAGSDADTQPLPSEQPLLAGTVPYMSPEQIRLEEVDEQSDIFSLGIVLYELVSGKHPFKRPKSPDTATIAAIVAESPPPLTHLTSDTERNFARIIRKCLEKNKEHRYQSAKDLLHDLCDLQRELEAKSQRNSLLAVLALVIVLAVAIIFIRNLPSHPNGPNNVNTEDPLKVSTSADVKTLAILPFFSANPDTEYLGDGISKDLIDSLSRIPRLSVKPFTIVKGYLGPQVDPQKVGRELNVDEVILGEVEERNERLIIHVRLVNTMNGSEIWNQSYELGMSDIIPMQQKIVVSIADRLQLMLSSRDKEMLTKYGTDNHDAHIYYLKGRYYWDMRDKENLKKAIEYFNKAIDLDPSYAQAWAGLANSYAVSATVVYDPRPTAEAMDKARYAAQRALEIDRSVSDAHISLGIVKLWYDWKWEEAEKEFKDAIDLDPNSAEAYHWYGHYLEAMGRADEAIVCGKKAQKLDPLSVSASAYLAAAFYLARQYDKALGQLQPVLEKNPDHNVPLYVLGLVYTQKRMYEEAIDTFQKIDSSNHLLAAPILGFTYGKMGRKIEAQRILNELIEISGKEYVPPQEIAMVCIGLGNRDQAFMWLEKAYNDRFGPLIYLKVEPLFDDLRSDPRFSDLVRRIGLEP